MQQMNLCYYYTPLYWQTACLIVDSGGTDGDGGNDYGRISRAASSLPGKVTPPDINNSGLTFTPLPIRNKILFGINPIRGLRRDTLDSIMKHRPFKSIPDLMERTGATVNQVQILIKAGVFNEIYDSNPRDIMIKFVDKIAVEDRDSLTMSNFEEVYNEGLISQKEYQDEYLLHMFRNAARANKSDSAAYNRYALEELTGIGHDYDEDGNVTINMKEFEKYYQSKMDKIRELLKSEEVIHAYNQLSKRKYWIKNCSGSIESWQMDTISFYPDKHEFDYIPIHNQFPVADFTRMSDRGVIAGTVIDKDKPKSIIYVSTKEAVVTVKMWRNVFNKFDEVITNGKQGDNREIYDDSWFDRGTRLVLVGRKSGEQFFLDNRRTNHRTPIYLIEGFDNETVRLREERIGK